MGRRIEALKEAAATRIVARDAAAAVTAARTAFEARHPDHQTALLIAANLRQSQQPRRVYVPGERGYTPLPRPLRQEDRELLAEAGTVWTAEDFHRVARLRADGLRSDEDRLVDPAELAVHAAITARARQTGAFAAAYELGPSATLSILTSRRRKHGGRRR